MFIAVGHYRAALAEAGPAADRKGHLVAVFVAAIHGEPLASKDKAASPAVATMRWDVEGAQNSLRQTPLRPVVLAPPSGGAPCSRPTAFQPTELFQHRAATSSGLAPAGSVRRGGTTPDGRALGGCWQAGAAVLGVLIVFLYPGSSYGKMVFGYYAGYEYWQMPPDQIDWSGLNCILHFAARPQSDGSINLDAFQLFPARIEQMVQLARQNDACVLLTLGGANTRRPFARATAKAAVRAKLVENIVKTVAQHGYDGVDIDWEPLQDRDEAQFVAFVRELRARLDTAVPGGMLTAAVGYEWGTLEHKRTTSIVASVIGELDFIHLMTYALAGPWGGWVTWHNSALYNGGLTFPGTTKELPSAELIVEQYAAAGVPASKMNLGLAFFGKIWQGGEGTPTGGVTAPRQSWTTKPSMSGETQYHEIIGRADFLDNQRWDEVAQNPVRRGRYSRSSRRSLHSLREPAEHQGKGPLCGRTRSHGPDDLGTARRLPAGRLASTSERAQGGVSGPVRIVPR